jgi:hypothetical protein
MENEIVNEINYYIVVGIIGKGIFASTHGFAIMIISHLMISFRTKYRADNTLHFVCLYTTYVFGLVFSLKEIKDIVINLSIVAPNMESFNFIITCIVSIVCWIFLFCVSDIIRKNTHNN